MDNIYSDNYFRGRLKVPFGGVHAIYKPIPLSVTKRKSSSVDDVKVTKPSNGRTSGALFDGELEAKKLHYALHGLEDNSKKIVDILAGLTQYQRSRIVYYYKHLFGRKLSNDFKELLGGDFEETCQSIISEPKVFLTKQIHKALKGFPYPREEELVSLLCERTNEEVQAIQETYQKRFGQTLENSLNDHLETEGAKFIKILINPLRQEDWVLTSLQAHMDAQNLLNLGIGVSYGDSTYPIVYSLLKKRGYAHLRGVFAEYYRLTGGVHVWNNLEKAMPQFQKKRLTHIMEAVDNPGLYSANIIHRSIKRYGMFSQTLLTVRLSRSKEFFRSVENAYVDAYDERLSDVIRAETDGENQFLLLSLVNF